MTSRDQTQLFNFHRDLQNEVSGCLGSSFFCLYHTESLQRRPTFNMPTSHRSQNIWIKTQDSFLCARKFLCKHPVSFAIMRLEQWLAISVPLLQTLAAWRPVLSWVDHLPKLVVSFTRTFSTCSPPLTPGTPSPSCGTVPRQ